MTEYGRGAGHEPWHPEDPLYGDQGWAGQQAGQGRQDPYGGQPQHYQQEPQQYQHDQQHHYQHDPQQQHDQQHQQQQPYYGGGQHYTEQQQYGHNGGWDAPQQQEPVPYGMNPAADPYAGQQPAYGADGTDYYAAPDAYPPPQPPGQRRVPEPEPATEWDAEQEAPEEHPFFTGADDGDDAEADEPREPRRGRGGNDRRGGKPRKKSRNGTACLFVAVVLVGGVGGLGYFGYQFYQDQFGAPEDFAGSGTGSVEVEIPKGAGLGQIGSILARKGVVKSSGAFVSAATANPKSQGIQPGVYPMKKEMSGKAAVDLMINPSNLNALIVKEGERNVGIYAAIDKKLKLDSGTTEDVAEKEFKDLGLPEWANDNPDIKDPLEGFLYPSRYDIGGKSTPKSVLKEMVTRAKAKYEAANVEAEAERLGLDSPMQLITVASLVQVEGKYKHDFEKVSRVVYNRLKPNNTETVGRLEFDSTINYIKAESRLDIGAVDGLRQIKDPYNTYDIKGLPPGAISNPGADALHSAINPKPGPWYYFVSVTADKTLFAVTNAEHEKNRRQYEEELEKSGQ
ncbi:endolytic transglycosylase MltG [Streptomyces albidochromogenes]|uniref:Endolytic murein transglycosylase n=1 Tax=Streptomyces albidochromogenes TaxID=329524 RepID=A0ABW6FWC2_9ACTN